MKVDEDGRRRGGMEWKWQGIGSRGGRSHSRGEKQAEWRRLSDRAYSPLCFRSQAWPARFSFSLYYTQTLTLLQCARRHTYTHLRVSLRSSSVYRAHSAPSVLHPRGRLVDLPFQLPRYSLGGQLHAPFGAGAFLLVFSFLPTFHVRLLHIQSYQKTPQRTAISLCYEGKNFGDFARV